MWIKWVCVYLHTHTYIYCICTYILCVCVCVLQWCKSMHMTNWMNGQMSCWNRESKIKPLGPNSANFDKPPVFGERILYFWFSFFFSRGKWNRNDKSIWLWPRAMTFVKSIVIECFAFPLAMTERWVVLICRPHVVMLSWHSGFDKPLLSAVCLRWQEVGWSTARRQSSWTDTARLQGLASVCYTEL